MMLMNKIIIYNYSDIDIEIKFRDKYISCSDFFPRICICLRTAWVYHPLPGIVPRVTRRQPRQPGVARAVASIASRG
jgi:hypothetical protein